jgi:hypothetical protein
MPLLLSSRAAAEKIMLLLVSRLPRYLITCSMTTTDGQHDRTGGPGGVAPKLTVPAYGLLSSG